MQPFSKEWESSTGFLYWMKKIILRTKQQSCYAFPAESKSLFAEIISILIHDGFLVEVVNPFAKYANLCHNWRLLLFRQTFFTVIDASFWFFEKKLAGLNEK